MLLRRITIRILSQRLYYMEKYFTRICDWKSFLLLFLFFIFESRFHASVKKKKEKLQFTSILSLTSYLNFFPSIFFFLFLILFLREDFLLDLISFHSIFIFCIVIVFGIGKTRYIYFFPSNLLFFFYFLIPFLSKTFLSESYSSFFISISSITTAFGIE